MAASQWRLGWFLGVAWTVALVWGEMVVFWLPPLSCTWPAPFLDANATLPSAQPTKVAFIADPQLAGSRLTSASSAPGFNFKRFTVDLFMRRAFQLSVLGLSPDYVFILGDLFEGGLEKEQEWRDTLRRYQHVFDDRRVLTRRQKSDKATAVKEVAGNRDVGFSTTIHMTPQILSRFVKEFSFQGWDDADATSLNSVIDVGGVQFIIVNSQTLDGDATDNLTAAAWDFLAASAQDAGPYAPPRLLLSHLPLHPHNSSCGPRLTGSSPWEFQTEGGRVKNQPYLSHQSTTKILDLLKPTRVFSGHWHDYCTSVHTSDSQTALETTVATFNPSLSNSRPSVVLLSVPPKLENAVANASAALPTTLCLLPSLQRIQQGYVALAMFSLLVLLFWPSKSFGRWWETALAAVELIKKGVQASRSQKLKDDDDVEVDMMFDAEGMMYLVPRPRITSSVSSGSAASDRRGSAHARHAAGKRQSGAGIEEGEVLQSDTLHGEGILPTYSRKHKSHKGGLWANLRNKVLGAVGPVTVLFAVEMALFVGLMAKDWT